MCKNDIIKKNAFERNTLSNKDTCCCQSILPFCVNYLVNKIVPWVYKKFRFNILEYLYWKYLIDTCELNGNL